MSGKTSLFVVNGALNAKKYQENLLERTKEIKNFLGERSGGFNKIVPLVTRLREHHLY